MLVDLNIEGKEVAVITGGEGEEAKERLTKLLDAGAHVTVIGEDFTEDLIEMRRMDSVRFVKTGAERFGQIIRELRPYVVIIAANDHRMNHELTRAAKSVGALISAIDSPSVNDFSTPAIAKIGNIRIAISTGGMSPAMARALRERIERLIKPEDVLQVELQGHIRRLAKQVIPDSSGRRELAYRIMKDRRIRHLLQQDRLEEAKVYAESIARKGAKLD